MGASPTAQNRFLRLNELWAERSALFGRRSTRADKAETLSNRSIRVSHPRYWDSWSRSWNAVYRRRRPTRPTAGTAPSRIADFVTIAGTLDWPWSLTELYRFGLLMKAVNLLASAEYLFTKSLDLYTEIGLPDYVRTIRGHLESVRQARGR